MKALAFFGRAVLAFGSLAFSLACSRQTSNTSSEPLVVYSYDSFATEWGPGGTIVPAFEAATGIDVELVGMEDAGQVLSRVISEKAQPTADVLIGIDNNLLGRALEENVFEAYDSPALLGIPERFLIDPEHCFLPFDYGWFSIVYDSQAEIPVPQSLENLTLPAYGRSLVLMDPRTSSPGLGFLLWTIAAYGENGWQDYWRRLRPSLLTVTDGWSQGYGLFTSGEAPLVLSYTTSPAYHIAFEETDRFRAAEFEEGHYLQIEGMGLIRNARHPEAARRFIDYMLSREAQETLPLTNFMYPVNPEAALPPAFDNLVQPDASLQIDAAVIRTELDRWLAEWTELMRE